MTTYITEYFDDTKLPFYCRGKTLIKFSGFKNNDKKEGSCIVGYLNGYSYYYEEVNFIDNKKNGPYKIYWKYGIKEEGFYKNDLKNGPYKKYWHNSKICEEGIYINDKKNGPYKKYDINSIISEEGIYINDLKNCPYKEYYPYEDLRKKGIYINNKKLK